MSRVCLNYDDGTKTEFTELADALYHLSVQGAAGVTNITDDGDGKVVMPRRSIDPKVRQINDAPDENRQSLTRQIAKEI